ncbi:MAG: FapA family protein [Oscillospiraceae bacterium]|nr:FapA family protein [Oscillospiraceae bacterium]
MAAHNIPTDSTVQIMVEQNQLKAHIMISEPKHGGKAPTYEELLKEIAALRITQGIHHELLKEMLSEGLYDAKRCFAEGTPANNGTDGTITYHYDKEVSLTPVEDDRGFVDYKDLGLIRNIKPGDVIADITLPTMGENGFDVRGNTLRCIPGKPAKYTIGANTALSEDGLQILSKTEGNINYRNGTFVVDNIVRVNGDVDAAVGNIDFSGDVEVKGEVTAGFKIISKSNIVVNGNVNGAILEAGGSILIKKGCINSQLKAEGNISINFCEYSKIHCEGDLSSVNFVICDVYCGGALSTKGNNGGLKGGKYVCLNSVDVCDVGTKKYTKTELAIGGNALLTKEKNDIIATIADIERKVNDVNLVINYLREKSKTESLSEEKEKTLGDNVRHKVLLGVEASKLKKRVAEIDDALKKRQFLSVGCRGVLYPGVKIIINDEAEKIEHENRRCKVFLSEDGTITIGTY